MPLDIKVNGQEGSVASILLRGSIDQETCRQLELELKDLADRKVISVVLDMGGVEYVSSAGIGIIIKMRNIISENNGVLSMTNFQPKVKKVFEIMKLTPLLNIT